MSTTQHEVESATSSPLAAWHAALGARYDDQLDATFGGRVPADYGDPAAERAVLDTGCGLVDRSWVGRMVATDADRQRFLGGLVTCDVSALTAGTGVYGFFTQTKGRVLADATFLALDDAIWIELPPGEGEAILAHVTRYRIADRVELMPLTSHLPLTLIGPGASAWVPGAEAWPLWQHGEMTIAGVPVRVVREGRFGVPAWTLWVAADAAGSLAQALVDDDRVQPVGLRALETLRIERGRPRFGADFGPESLPQETGLEAEAVSYTKGCYLGQEVVARIHYRGGVQRQLRGLRAPLDADVVVGTTLVLDGRPVGRVTSMVPSSHAEARVGIGLVHRRGAEIGTTLTTEQGVAVEVAELSPVGPAT